LLVKLDVRFLQVADFVQDLESFFIGHAPNSKSATQV
jgi:hypothetical protein